MSTREPVPNTVPIAELRPTQVTVGHREVAEKRRDWAGRDEGDRAEWLGRHVIPVLVGPKKRHSVIDHHHLTRALLEEDGEAVLVNVVADLSMLDKDAFWVFADNHGWCRPYDAEGRRAGFDAIPRDIAGLADDPYRSLAGALRRAGGYAKETVPFTEFMWADALRRRIRRREVDESFSGALLRALEFAKGRDARYLPGWCGPNDGN